MRYARAMELIEVIARDHRGRPLRRLMLEVAAGKGFICHPDTYEDCRKGAAYPVGFPLSDLFIFDEQLFARLESAFRRKDNRSLKSIWGEAKPVTAT